MFTCGLKNSVRHLRRTKTTGVKMTGQSGAGKAGLGQAGIEQRGQGEAGPGRNGLVQAWTGKGKGGNVQEWGCLRWVGNMEGIRMNSEVENMLAGGWGAKHPQPTGEAELLSGQRPAQQARHNK